MKDFLKSKLFNAIFSVMLAIFLMFYVDSLSILPSSEKTYSDITVSVMNLPEGMILDSEVPKVDLRVKGYTSTINSAGAKDVKTWVDLKDTETGTNTYKVQTSLPSGLEMVWIRPATLNLTVDTQGEKAMTLKVQTQNSVAEGYGSYAPSVNPEQVTLSGPQMLLDQVTAAVVTVDLSGLTADHSVELPVALYNSQGERVEDQRIVVSNPKVWVGVRVTENKSSKSVVVRPAFFGEPDEKYKSAGVEVTPTTVKIAGSFDRIKNIEYLNTEPIDLTGATQDYVVQTTLVVPEGVEVLEGNQVEVKIKIEEDLTYWVFEGVPVEIVNPPEGGPYVAIPAEVDVTVAAYPWVFARDSTDEGSYDIPIRVYVDLQGQHPDNQEYQLLTEAPADYRVTQMSAQTVQVVS
ncbi:MAG: CdaR family protein [Peptococcaceae bacterium]|nr:CdaR family protein [Peptococcaceae bacterium]